jgi:hypothetical protein
LQENINILGKFWHTFKPKLEMGSVADPGCLSRILDPDFNPFRIPDLGSRISDPRSQISDTGSKSSHKFHKIENYFIFEVLKKKFGSVFKEF